MKETIGWIGVGSMGHRMSRHLVAAGYPAGGRRCRQHRAGAEGRHRRQKQRRGRRGSRHHHPVAARRQRQPGRRQEIAAAAPTARQDRDRHLHDRHQGRGGGGRDSRRGRHRTSSTRRSRAARPAPTRPRSPSCWPARADAYERFKPLMSLMGKPFHVGPKPGQGQAIKLLNNFLSATALAATSEAIAFGTGQGIEMKTILDIVNASSGRNSATDDKFPRRIMHGTLRRRLHGQAAAQGHPPLPGECPGCWYHRRDRQRGGRCLGAHGGDHAGRRHHRDVPLHAEGAKAETC